jgi:hypothetical protein
VRKTVWRKSYEQIVDCVATNEALALALGEGKLVAIGYVD